MKYQILLLSVVVSNCLMNLNAMSPKKNTKHVKTQIDYSIYGMRKAISVSDFEIFQEIMNKLSEKQYDFKADKDTQGRNLLLLACIAKTIDKRIIGCLVNLEISPLQKAKGKGLCALDVITNKIAEDSTLADLKELFSAEIWAAWEDEKEAEKQAELEAAEAERQAAFEKLETERRAQENYEDTSAIATGSTSLIEDEPNIPGRYTIDNLRAAISLSEKESFVKMFTYFNQTDNSVFDSVDAETGINLINLAVRVDKPNNIIISLLLNLGIDPTKKDLNNQSAIDIIRSRTDLESEITSLFSKTLYTSQGTRLAPLTEGDESSSTALDFFEFDFSKRSSTKTKAKDPISDLSNDEDVDLSSISHHTNLVPDGYEQPPRRQGSVRSTTVHLDADTQSRKKQDLGTWKKNGFMLACAGALITYTGIIIRNKYVKSKPIKK